ncbi:MAG: MBL fold metallo-hydrolase [Terriglobia bacterium]
MNLSLTVHRGTRQIGGCCIEIEHPRGDRLILDAGRPLDAPEDATGLLPASLDRTRPATVLISHPHQDHWGLVEELPATWPIWTGSKSAKLIAITSDVTRRPLTRTFETWNSRSGPFAIGPFTVKPYLTDHSAFDAYMLLVEGAGKRILYTGDFRRHGRKSVLVDQFMANPPPDIDVLVTEGTNLGSDKPVKSEKEIEQDFVELFKRIKGRVFVSWSGQNIDRLAAITANRAAGTSWREWRKTASPHATWQAAATSSCCAVPCCATIRLAALCPQRMTPSTSPCGAATCRNRITQRRWNGARRVAPRSPISTPAAMPQPPICAPSHWPSGPKWSCRCMA